MNLIRSLFRTLAITALLTAGTLRASTIIGIQFLPPVTAVSNPTELANAITAANATPTTANTISLAAGTYTLTADLPDLAANGLTLQGPTTGAPAILEANGLASGVIFNVTANQVSIANLSLRNARSHAITVQPGANTGRIENCAFDYPTAPAPKTAAIDGNNCLNWTVTGNRISAIVGSSATAEPAIHFYGGASGTVITNNFILNCDRAIGLGGDATPITPTVTHTPLGTTVTAGQTATFTVGVAGTPAPTYQWQKNGTAINGATSASYTTPATTSADNGAVFTVVITNSAGSTSSSATLTVTASPLAPSGLVAVPGDGQVALTWSASISATLYHVRRATTTGGPYTQVAGPASPTYTDTGLTNGTTYYYVVTALNATGESGSSSEVTAVPAAPILSYNFEDDAVGQAPAHVTVLGGELLVTATGPTGITGQVLHDSSATQRSAPSVGRLDLWGDPTSNDQVMLWRRWPSFTTAPNIDGVVLRSQAGTTLSSAASYTGLTQGYLFLVNEHSLQLEIRKLRTGGYDTLSTAALAVGTLSRYRASVIGSRLRFEHSTDGQIWTTDIDITDTTFAQATGRPLYVNGFDSWNPNSVYVDGFTLTDHIVTVVLVTSVTLDQTTLTGAQASTSQLTWSVAPANATFPAITFSSDDPSIASVNSAGLLSFVSPGTCTITAQGTSGTPSTLLVHTTDASGRVPSMKVGINFWNKNWEDDNTYFKTELLDPQHPEAWAAQNLNPWRPELLADLAIFNGPIRLMDMNNTNGSPIVHWADRYPQTYPQYQSWVGYWANQTKSPMIKVIAIDPALLAIPDVASYYTSNGVTATTYQIGDLSYEWMIDLCNRTGRDMWINVPAFADHDFMTKLATLINTTLDPKLKVYVEYSNEYWNYISVATGYGYAKGASLGLPGGNKWYQGAAWCVYHSLEVFKAFEDVFGAQNTGYGKRLCRVIAFSADSSLLNAALQNVVYSGGPSTPFNPTWNPSGQKPDVLAIAPYIGPNDPINGGKLDGADPQIATKYRASVDWTITNYVKTFRTIAQNYGLPLVTYEGGQQLDTNAGAWSANPLIYAEYLHFLDQLNANGVKLFNHYTLYGTYSTGGAWGLKSDPSKPNTTAGGSPKYQAVQDWLLANP